MPTDEKPSVLVVDDSDLIRRMLTTILKDGGYSQIQEATDGRKALEHLQESSSEGPLPGLITLDWDMPLMSGLEVLKTIRSHSNPDLKKIPVIMITANSMRKYIIEAMKAGANNFIVKPFDKDNVLEKITKTLSRVQSSAPSQPFKNEISEKDVEKIASDALQEAFSTIKSQQQELTEKDEILQKKNQELEATVNELKMTNEIINQAYKDLKNAKLELHETQKIAALTKTFQKFVPEQFINRMEEGIENIEVGEAESDFVTTLFSDIRNFTPFAEQLSPQEVFDFLNTYFQRLSEPISRYSGFIDKFIGDAMMVLFNQPERSNEEGALDAVQTAVAIQQTMNTYNEQQMAQGHLSLDTGVGIHSGPVILGTVGSSSRMDFTIIGDAVNVASRLESLTKQYGVSLIVSQVTLDLLGNLDAFHWRELDVTKVKGRTEPIVIYEIFSGDPKSLFDLKCQFLPTYVEGLEQYKSQNWSDALACFDQCLQICPDDQVSLIYQERAQMLLKHPPKNPG